MEDRVNHQICCDVCDCTYNVDGKRCKKQTISVSCSEKGCTCCESYSVDD